MASVAPHNAGIIDGKKLKKVQRHDVQPSLKKVCLLVNKLFTYEFTIRPKHNYSYSSTHTLKMFSLPIVYMLVLYL